jgi:glycosyltransferase involved in cell wall biosynthesis
MRIFLLSAANVGHTVRWANALAEAGIEVHLASVHPFDDSLDSRVFVHHLPVRAPFGYFFSFLKMRQLIKKINPDLLNAHYATGYGLLAMLVGFKPTLLSVWGSDVYDFPEKSFLHKLLVRKILSAMTAIASTSHCMAKRTNDIYKHRNIFITPFGVDENIFYPVTKGPPSSQKTIVIGTVKTLANKYGIDTLLEAFSIVQETAGKEFNLTLEISGGGPDFETLKNLASKLGIEHQTVFHGSVPHNDVPHLINKLDIYVALSRLDSESFGVAIIEASACGKPVVVSDADGPAEVVVCGKTGIVVERNNPIAAANALLELIYSDDLRNEIGLAGRSHVIEHYRWSDSVKKMIDLYKRIINKEID